MLRVRDRERRIREDTERARRERYRTPGAESPRDRLRYRRDGAAVAVGGYILPWRRAAGREAGQVVKLAGQLQAVRPYRSRVQIQVASVGRRTAQARAPSGWPGDSPCPAGASSRSVFRRFPCATAIRENVSRWIQFLCLLRFANLECADEATQRNERHRDHDGQEGTFREPITLVWRAEPLPKHREGRPC